MNIVYASNDNYARHLGVSLCSLLHRNRQAEEITVYVLSIGLGEENRRKLAKIGEKYGRDVFFVDIANLRERLGYRVDTGRFDISTLGRLFLGSLLPETVSRILYLDCDTVVLGDLEPFWNTDLGENLAAAVMEPTIYPQVKRFIGLEEEAPYFNAGVLLLDLARWRQEKLEQQMMDFYREHGGRLYYNDQDVVNGVLKGRICPVSPRYNFFTNYRYFHYGNLVSMMPCYGKAVEKQEFRQAKRKPVVLHYMGDERPWKRGNRNHYRKAYEKYLECTPWKGTKKEKGKEIYMLAYHLMDYLTFLCPPVRRGLSRYYMAKQEKRMKQA